MSNFISCNYIFCLCGMKKMFYLMTHSTHFIYSYMASDIWYIYIARDIIPGFASGNFIHF